MAQEGAGCKSFRDISASVRPQALAWRGHEPPEAVAGSGGLESGGGQRSAAGGPAARRMRFGRVAPADPRASRRLCRTLGLSESPTKRTLFDRRRSRDPVRADPAARCRRVHPRRKNLSFARLENGPHPPHSVHAFVGNRRPKSTRQKLAEREGFEPPLLFCSKRALQARAIGHSATSPQRANFKLVPEKGLEPIRP